MGFLKEKVEELSGEGDFNGIANPWSIWDPAALATPTVHCRREAIEEIKKTYFAQFNFVPQEFRILCSWDVRQKMTVRPGIGFEI